MSDFVRRRAVPEFYAVDEELRVLFSCGVSRHRRADRLPSRVEQIVRALAESVREDEDCAVAVDGETVVRIVDSYAENAKLRGVIVEKLRRRDPLQEAIERFGITAREAQVLRLLLLGASTATIAQRLVIAETTAVDHVKRIGLKTAARGRGRIVARVLGFC